MGNRLGDMLAGWTSLYGDKDPIDWALDMQTYAYLGHDLWLRLHGTSTNILNDALRGSLGASLDRDLRFNFD